MKVDAKRTRAARARHSEGIAVLNRIFRWNEKDAERFKRPKHSRPRSRRIARKRAHESRRRNRA